MTRVFAACGLAVELRVIMFERFKDFAVSALKIKEAHSMYAIVAHAIADRTTRIVEVRIHGGALLPNCTDWKLKARGGADIARSARLMIIVIKPPQRRRTEGSCMKGCATMLS